MNDDENGQGCGRRSVLKAGLVLGVGIGSAGCTDMFRDGGDPATTTPTPELTPTASLQPEATPTPTPKTNSTTTPTSTEMPTRTPTPTNPATSTPTSTPTPSPGQRKLAASDGESRNSFGKSVAVADEGSTALVGAPGDGDPNGSGSVYVFSPMEDRWVQDGRLVPDEGGGGDGFGRSVAVSEDATIALIGAPGTDEGDTKENVGAAYVFGRSGGTWSQVAKLEASSGTADDWLGGSVAVTGDGSTAVVGAAGYEDTTDEATAENLGAAYVFARRGGAWTEEVKLTADDGDDGDRFGSSVAVNGDSPTVLVGARRDEDPNGFDAGSAYVFELTGGEWSQQAKLAASDGDRWETFGRSVALAGDGTTALIGASQHSAPSGRAAGAAYVFSRNAGSWSEETKLVASDGDFDDRFGRSVALSVDGTTAIVGAFQDEDPNGDRAGSAYQFDWSTDGTWSEEVKLVATDGDAKDNFGDSVAVSGDSTTALVGAPGDEDPNGDFAGSAYTFSL
jgi:hypothetical protein